MSRRRIDLGPAARLEEGEQTVANLAATATIWRGGSLHVALCPEFDMANQGATARKVRVNHQENLELLSEFASPEDRKRRWCPPIG